MDVNEGTTQYRVWVNGDYIHFVVNGNRYKLNRSSNTVDRLVVQDIPATTVDFSTSYSTTQLKDNLSQNVRTTILNQIVQNVIDSTCDGFNQIDIEFRRPLDLYLDMFTDSASLDNYIIANNGLEIDSEECVKFAQVYKNNLLDIDESRISYGNVYRHLTDNIQKTFGLNSNVIVVDSPSIEVRRMD